MFACARSDDARLSGAPSAEGRCGQRIDAHRLQRMAGRVAAGDHGAREPRGFQNEVQRLAEPRADALVYCTRRLRRSPRWPR